MAKQQQHQSHHGEDQTDGVDDRDRKHEPDDDEDNPEYEHVLVLPAEDQGAIPDRADIRGLPRPGWPVASGCVAAKPPKKPGSQITTSAYLKALEQYKQFTDLAINKVTISQKDVIEGSAADMEAAKGSIEQQAKKMFPGQPVQVQGGYNPVDGSVGYSIEPMYFTTTTLSEAWGGKVISSAGPADVQDTEKLMGEQPYKMSFDSVVKEAKPKAGKPSALEKLKHELAEAVVYDAAKHPRWPPGTVDFDGKKIGGEYMAAGQTFEKDGQRWEIQSVADGHVIANEASGEINKAETRVFDPAKAKFEDGEHPTIPGVSVAPSKKYSSGKYFKSKFTSPIVDASPTAGGKHDPKIKLPSTSELTAEQWKRFGRADQLYYREVMSRFGAWKHGGENLLSSPEFLHNKVAQEMNKVGDYSAVNLVESVLGSQKGSSTGSLLDLSNAFDSLSATGSALDTARKKYEKAREAEQQMNAVIAWDLYNRLKAPDITVLHRNEEADSWWSKVINGQNPLMSGLSATWTTSWNWGESHVLGFAIPIRNVVMATDIAGWASSYETEHEVSNGNRMKLSPENSAFWTDYSVPKGGPVFKWLDKQLHSHPKSGQVIEDFAAHLLGKKDLPLPPADSNFTITKHPGGAKAYTIPSDTFMHTVEDSIAKDPGKLISSYEPISGLNLVPGDIIATKNTETRYLVIKDNSTPTGLSYLALQKGQFGNYESGDKKFTFSSMSASRYKVDKHFDIPEPVQKLSTYNPADWKPAGPKVKANTLVVGDKIRVNSEDWQVTHKSTSAISLKSMTTDTEATVNPLWMTQKLKEAAFDPKLNGWAVHNGQVVKITLLSGAKGKKPDVATIEPPGGEKQVVKVSELSKLDALPDVQPQAGDTFAFNAKKYKVTSVAANGSVKAKASTGGVKTFKANDPALALLVRPSDYSLGNAQKLGTMEPGTLISGSKQTVRPYMVLGQVEKQTSLLNLDTGEISLVSGGKSYPLLAHKDTSEPQSVVQAIPHDQWKNGDQVPAADLLPGDQFVKNSTVYVVVTNGENALTVKPKGGVPQSMTKNGTVSYGGIESAPVSGDAVKLTDAPVGTEFTVASDIFSSGYAGDVPSWWAGKTGPFTITNKTGLYVEVTDANGNANSIHVGSSVGKNTMIVPLNPTAALSVDPGSLPTATITGYLHNHSGKYKHPPISQIPEGDVFVDKKGAIFKVKQQGAVPIVTDGTDLFQAPAHLFVNHWPDGVIIDHSPPVSGPEKQTYDQMIANGKGESLKDLGLDEEPGSQMWVNGSAWTLEQDGYWHQPDGGKFAWAPGTVPEKYIPIGEPWITPPDNATPKSLGLGAGDQAKSPSGSQYTIAAAGKNVVVIDQTGNAHQLGALAVSKYKKYEPDQKVAISDLKPGDVFTTDGFTYTLLDGGKVQLPSGSVTSLSTDSPMKVTKVDLAPVPGTIGSLGAGADFKIKGQQWKIMDGKLWSTTNKLWPKDSAPHASTGVVAQDATGKFYMLNANGVPDPEAKPEPGVMKPADITPFLYPKSGSSKHPPVHTLEPGDVFKDKNGKQFVLVSHAGDHSVAVDDKQQMVAVQHKTEGKPTYVKKVGEGDVPDSTPIAQSQPQPGGKVMAKDLEPGDVFDSGHGTFLVTGKNDKGTTFKKLSGTGVTNGQFFPTMTHWTNEYTLVSKAGQESPAAQALQKAEGIYHTPDGKLIEVGKKYKWKDLPLGTVVDAHGDGQIQKYQDSNDGAKDGAGYLTNYAKVISGAPAHKKVGKDYYIGTENNEYKVVSLPGQTSGVMLKDLPEGTVFNTPNHPWFNKKGEPQTDQWQVGPKGPTLTYLKPVGGTGKAYPFTNNSEVGELIPPETPHTGSAHPNDPILSFYNNQDAKANFAGVTLISKQHNGYRVLTGSKDMPLAILKPNQQKVLLNDAMNPILLQKIEQNKPAGWASAYVPPITFNGILNTQTVKITKVKEPQVGSYPQVPDMLHPNPEGKQLDQLKLGSYYALPTGQTWLVHQITGPSQEKVIPVKTQGGVSQASSDYIPPYIWEPEASEPEKMPLNTMRPGDIFSNGNTGGIQWLITGPQVAGKLPHVVYASGSGGKVGHSGKTSSTYEAFKVGHVSLADKPSAAQKGKATKYMKSMNVGDPAIKLVHQQAIAIHTIPSVDSWADAYDKALHNNVNVGHPSVIAVNGIKTAIGPDPAAEDMDALNKALDDSLKQTATAKFKDLALGDHFISAGALYRKTSPYDAKLLKIVDAKVAGPFSEKVGDFVTFNTGLVVKHADPVEHKWKKHDVALLDGQVVQVGQPTSINGKVNIKPPHNDVIGAPEHPVDASELEPFDTSDWVPVNPGDSGKSANKLGKGTGSKLVASHAPSESVATGAIPDYTAVHLTNPTPAGGTTGAQFANGSDNQKYLLKTYQGDENRVGTELLANAIYQQLGIKAPKAGTYTTDQGKIALAYPLEDGKLVTNQWSTTMKKKFAQGYVADALLGSYDHIGLERDNVLWNSSVPTRVDQGGTFFYRAQGKKKDYKPYPDELTTMLTIGQAGQNDIGKQLTQQNIRDQAEDVANKLTPEKIDQLVDAAPFSDLKMKEQIRENLKARIAVLSKIATGAEPLPEDMIPWLKS